MSRQYFLGDYLMGKKNHLKPIAAALGTTFAITLAASPLVNASENPFSATEFSSGYMVADSHGEGKCGEGKAMEKEKEGKCGEGKCGEGKIKAKDAEGKCGEAEAKGAEGKCGEGKCGEGK
jgi:uncharacterized low-complexity protein